MLLAERDSFALALASSAPWLARSVGFVGVSDGWQELQAHKRLHPNLPAARKTETSPSRARSISARRTACSCSRSASVRPRWKPVSTRASACSRISTRRKPRTSPGGRPGTRRSEAAPLPKAPRRSLYHLSAAVLQTHESKRVEGGVIASLSIPWGFSKGDDDLGGYHLTWPRDLVETAGGFLAVGARHAARRVLRYLEVTQEPDGHWSQNMWLDGTPYWQGIQMDETALPILLVDLAAREGVIDQSERDAFWPMVRRAAAFLARNGPVSPQDRWEEDPGYSPFTIAAEIAALLVAADLADAAG